MTFRVFISSTYVDLPEHRQRVGEAIRQLGLIDISMETFGARDERPLDECVRILKEETDIFVGFYAHRYGFVPSGSEESIVEIECKTARDENIPRFLYVIDELQPWRVSHIDKGESFEKLNNFKKKIMSEVICQRFTEIDDLAAKIASDIGRYLYSMNTKRVSSSYRNRQSLELSIHEDGQIVQFAKAEAEITSESDLEFTLFSEDAEMFEVDSTTGETSLKTSDSSPEGANSGRYFHEISFLEDNENSEMFVHAKQDFERKQSDWVMERDIISENCRNVFMTHVVRPSSDESQVFDAIIRLERKGKKQIDGDVFSDVTSAEFFLGKYWRNRIFHVDGGGNNIGIAVSAYDSFLCICRLEFNDGHLTTINRFVDFEPQL